MDKSVMSGASSQEVRGMHTEPFTTSELSRMELQNMKPCYIGDELPNTQRPLSSSICNNKQKFFK